MGGQSYPSVKDPRGRTAIGYGLYGVPETFFLDASGRVAYKHIGAVSAAVLTRVVDSLVAARQPGAGQRADSVLEARTAAVAADLRCPVCQGLSIQDSPTELALQMRGVVKDQLRAGKSPDDVKAYFGLIAVVLRRWTQKPESPA